MDRPRTPRRSSSVKIEKWGLVELWLAAVPGRMAVLAVEAGNFQVRVIDPFLGERIEKIHSGEDVGSVALRAISRFD